MAARSLSMRGQFSPGGAAADRVSTESSGTSRTAPSPESQVPQPHSRRPPSGTCTRSPHVLHRMLGMRYFHPLTVERATHRSSPLERAHLIDCNRWAGREKRHPKVYPAPGTAGKLGNGSAQLAEEDRGEGVVRRSVVQPDRGAEAE